MNPKRLAKSMIFFPVALLVGCAGTTARQAMTVDSTAEPVLSAAIEQATQPQFEVVVDATSQEPSGEVAVESTIEEPLTVSDETLSDGAPSIAAEQTEMSAEDVVQIAEVVYTPRQPKNNQILFDTNSVRLNTADREVIGAHAAYLMANPGLTLSIHGHSDGRGEPQLNQKLSEQRAHVVAKELREMGVPEERIEIIGYGADVPRIDPEQFSDNRRVEMYFVDTFASRPAEINSEI